MPVEGICTIMGRGTVVPGRSEKGRMIAGIPVGIIGMEVEQLTATVIGLEMFRKN